MKAVKSIPFFLVGVGGVGLALLDQLRQLRDHHSDLYGIQFNCIGACDSTTTLLGEGLPLCLNELLEVRQSGERLSSHPGSFPLDLTALLAEISEPDLLIADCSVSDNLEAFLSARSAGASLAFANKKPLVQEIQGFRELTQNDPLGRRVRWESTVGAGLPVIASLLRLRAAGDRVHKIRGSLSSTMGRLMTGVEKDRLLSEVVAEAREDGYTEPDPREDLRGFDLARKGVITGRTAGWDLELDAGAVEGLCPPSLDTIPLTEFLDRLSELDIAYKQKLSEILDNGRVPRCLVTVSPEGCAVAVEPVELDSPFARLEGNEQLVEIYTDIYRDSPLRIEGRGGGVDATAAGVLSDLIELSH